MKKKTDAQPHGGVKMIRLELRNEKKRIYLNPAWVAIVTEMKDETDAEKTIAGAAIVTLHNGSAFWVRGTPGDIASLIGPVVGF